MTKKTTADCKNFLVEFFKNHPDFLYVYSTLGFDDLDAEMRKDSLVPSLWKRAWKGKPTQHDCNYWPENRIYNKNDIFADNKAPETIDSAELKTIRIFELNPAKWETNIVFMVLEKNDGTLLLGNYIGCDDESDADWRTLSDE